MVFKAPGGGAKEESRGISVFYKLEFPVGPCMYRCGENRFKS